MIVHREAIPPIWHPIARFRYWRARRARIKASLLGDFSEYLLPVIKSGFPPTAIQEIVSAQHMSESYEKARAADNVFEVRYVRTRWYGKLWRWAKGDPGGGCCR